MSERLIVFTRYPEPHKSKTRLIPALGAVGAAVLGREMTRHALRRASELADERPVSIEVRFEGGDEALAERCFGPATCYRAQRGGDLGARMNDAFDSAFRAAAGRAVIVGTDCPGVTAPVVREAFDRLEHHDLVLGPATDGGYYLIGLRGPAPRLFRGISWGGETVLEETLRAAVEMELSTSLLAPLDDVDRPEDLNVWRRARDQFRHDLADARISVVIPTLNEEAFLGQTLRCLRKAARDAMETIVVDGGSRDRTLEIARDHDCRTLTTAPGRAWQMNAGAAEATGSILLFLHADTQLPKDFPEHVRRTLAQANASAGAFAMRIDAPEWPFRVVERMINFRSRCFRMPYGDQAIFLPADTFYLEGGFPELPILEDFELMRRLRRRGRVAIVPKPVVTSARRWRALGLWRTTWINQRVVLGYYLGVPPKRLARWYHGGDRGRR
ncbi:MAG: TIGR04283 family arsenosugar biosynthesis glycosyltransferase [Planctomycetota bacterium]